MAVNKVIYGGNTLVDLTGDTVTAADLADGVKATSADGNPIVGLMAKVTIDSSLSDTSTNPVQNKAIYNALQGKVGTSIFTRGFAFFNPDASIRWLQNSHVTGSINASNYAGTAYAATHDAEGNVIAETYARKNTANNWSSVQGFAHVKLGIEKYLSSEVEGTSNIPTLSVMHYIATGAFTLDLKKISAFLETNESTVFTAYIKSSADYPLTITNAGTLKYVGSASDVAITSAGLLLNILVVKDSKGNVISTVQASKLDGGA